MKKSTLLAVCATVLLFFGSTGSGWGQQVIGSFPLMDGGFEAQTTDPVTTLYTTTWSHNGTSATLSTSGGRSGPNYVTFIESGTSHKRLISPNVTGWANSTTYVIQFWYQGDLDGTISGDIRGGVTPLNSNSSAFYYSSYTNDPNTGSTWTLFTGTATTASLGVGSGNGIFSVNNTGSFKIDDFVVYAGSAADVTAPNSPGAVTVGNATTSSLDVSWVSASGGVDGGGYVVVRYATNPNADNDPNQNGIYAVGNTTTNGTGGLTGTVRYIGTSTSFTDNVGLSAGTQYWYKVYTVDKAFNYSAESSGNGTTATAGAPSLSISGTTDHGSVCVSSSAAPIQYTITNSGSVAAENVSLAVSGANPSDFAITTALSSTTIAASGGTATYSVTFTPSGSGARSATVTATSTTAGCNTPTSNMTGTGLATVTQAVTASAATSVVNTTATLNGNVTALGVCPSTTEKGFVYSLTSVNNNPEVGGTGVTKTSVGSPVAGAYTLELTNLTPATGYSFKAYVYDGTTYTYSSSALTFTTLGTATKLAFGTAPPASGFVGVPLTTFTVQAQRADNSVDAEYTGTITLVKVSGTGNLAGTFSKAAVAGVATFDAVQFDEASTYTIKGTATGLSETPASENIVITLQPLSIFANPITGSSPGNSNPYTTNQTFNANISVSGIGRGTGVTGATGNDRYNTTSWTTTTAIDVNDYFEFILTPNIGYKINFDNLNFTFQRSNSGPSVFKVRSSLDAFATDLGTYNNTGDNSPSNVTLQLTGAEFDEISSAITFRIYAHTATSSTATASINDFIFYGNVSCIQPVAYSVSGGGVFCSGGTGVAVGLSNSQIGVNYLLKLDGSNTGSTIAGTGLAISFGNQTLPGLYTVVGSNTNGSCNYTANMTGSATVTVNPLPVAPTGANVDVNNFCANAGGDISLTATGGSGTTLRWLTGGCDGTPIGTGSPLVIAKPTTTTTYYARWENVCGNSACASVVVTVIDNVTPSVTITASANPITSGTSVAITATPVNGGNTPMYQFYINNVAYSSPPYNPSLSFAPPAGSYDIYVVMTPDPSLPCFSPATATSNTINLVVTPSPATSTWTGSGNDQNWHNADNWDNGVPGSTTAVTIPSGLLTNYPTVSSSAMCASITIMSGASLINNGLLGIPAGQATVKRVIADASDDKWHLFISPITQNIAATASSCFNGAYLDRYDEPSGEWVRLATGDNVVPDYGYSINYLSGSRELVFTGTFKNSPLTYSNLSFHNGAPGYGAGWNLIGNPYPCGINPSLCAAPSGMNAFAYVWNTGSGNYLNLQFGSSTTVIAPLQGFFVRTTSATNSLTLSNNAKTHGGTFYKNDNVESEAIVVKISGNNYSDQSTVRFNSDATAGFDQSYDAYKLWGLDEAPQLYSILPDENAAVNTLPAIDANPLVPLGLKVGAETSYTLTFEGMESFDSQIPLRLDDLKLGISKDLRTDPVYSFTAAPGDAENRFRLRFASAIGFDNPEASNILINAERNVIRVNYMGSSSGIIHLYNDAGQLLSMKSLNQGETTISAEATGIYIVKVITGKSVVTKKVVVVR